VAESCRLLGRLQQSYRLLDGPHQKKNSAF